MNLFDQISEDIKQAMLAKDKVALDALRGIKKEFLEAKTAKGSDGELHDDRALQILQKMVKQRKEAAEMFRGANRPELADDEIIKAGVPFLIKPTEDVAEKLYIQSAYISAGETTEVADGKVSWIGEWQPESVNVSEDYHVATIPVDDRTFKEKVEYFFVNVNFTIFFTTMFIILPALAGPIVTPIALLIDTIKGLFEK